MAQRRKPIKTTRVERTSSIAEPVLFGHLAACERILIAGAGGGFDIYAGLPLAHALWRRGQTVHLANLSFTNLAQTDAVRLTPALCVVTPETTGPAYFPEGALARFLSAEGLPSTVYTFAKVGVRQLLAAYQALVEKLEIDAIVLVDGGTDILMFGDEEGLGTPVEDMTSLAAVGQLRIAHRHVACVGFGIDAYHGVCHAHFLENVAALERDGAYHGAFSVTRSTPEGALYLKAVEHAERQHRDHPSIVNGSIAAALEGKFGDVHFSKRTEGTELFINPLMAIYFTFDLMGLCHRNLYLRELVDAPSTLHVQAIISAHHQQVQHRPPRRIPH
ncbi:MAG TPA: DUF1152 domain-containing protein [Kofleriaceae bacterium]